MEPVVWVLLEEQPWILQDFPGRKKGMGLGEDGPVFHREQTPLPVREAVLTGVLPGL